MLNISSENAIRDNGVLNSASELYETFVHFFTRGAPAERFMADETTFDRLVVAIENKQLRMQVF
jgi:hypothetical protein